MQYSGTLFCVQSKFLGYCVSTSRLTCWVQLDGAERNPTAPLGYLKTQIPFKLGFGLCGNGSK